MILPGNLPPGWMRTVRFAARCGAARSPRWTRRHSHWVGHGHGLAPRPTVSPPAPPSGAIGTPSTLRTWQKQLKEPSGTHLNCNCNGDAIRSKIAQLGLVAQSPPLSSRWSASTRARGRISACGANRHPFLPLLLPLRPPVATSFGSPRDTQHMPGNGR